MDYIYIGCTTERRNIMENEKTEAQFEQKGPKKREIKKISPLMLIGIAALVLLVVIAAAIAVADRADTADNNRTHGVYTINSESVLDLGAYTSGVAVLTSNSVDYVDSFGNLMSANEHTYTNPVMITSGKNLVLYDRGGNLMKIEKNASLYKSFTFDAPVSCADITANGTYAYVLNGDSGYQSHLFVYSYKGKKLFEWSSAEYVVRVSVSDSGNSAAVSTVSVENADTLSKVYLFQFNKNTYDYAEEFIGETVFDIDFAGGKKLAVLTDRGAYLMTAKGERSALCEYSANELNHTDLKKGSLGIVSVNLYGDTNNTKVYLFDKGYKNVSEQSYQNAISGVIADLSYYAVIFDKEIYILNSKGIETGHIQLDEICMDAVVSGGKLYVLTSGGIQHFGLHETVGDDK